MATTEPSPPGRRPVAGAAGRVVVALAAGFALLVACTPAATVEPEPDPSVGAALTADIEEYLGGVPNLDRDVRAVLVTVDGETVVELYRDTTADEFRNVYSVTKSVLGTLVGIAVDEGLLDLDAPLSGLLPQHAAAMSPEVAVATVRDLLTMTAPFRNSWFGGWDPPTDDWVADAIARTDRTPGDFSYSDPGTHVLAAVLAQATGMSVLDYGRRKLFDPLGVDTAGAPEIAAREDNIAVYEDADFAWPVDAGGVHTGASLLRLRPVDMQRLGMLYLGDGRWDGRQLVSPEWIRAATTQQVPAGAAGAGDGYGYLWWVDRTASGYDTAIAWGYGGQLVEVVPELELVAVVSTESDLRTAGTSVHPTALVFNVVNQRVIPAAEEILAVDR